MTSLDAHLERFTERLRARLVAGAAKYGDTSFRRPITEILDELQQELEDIAGWGLIAWVRIERLRRQLDQVTGQPAGDIGSPPREEQA